VTGWPTAANRRVHGQWQSAIPSRFIDELPPEHVEVESDQGLYSGGDRFGAGQSLGFGGGSYGGGGYGGSRFGRERLRGPERDAEATLIHAKPQGFGIGERVFHQKFGYGHIIAIDDNKLAISFDKAGDKKVLDSFVVPADSV